MPLSDWTVSIPLSEMVELQRLFSESSHLSSDFNLLAARVD